MGDFPDDFLVKEVKEVLNGRKIESQLDMMSVICQAFFSKIKSGRLELIREVFPDMDLSNKTEAEIESISDLAYKTRAWRWKEKPKDLSPGLSAQEKEELLEQLKRTEEMNKRRARGEI